VPGLTDPHVDGASLAACQKDASSPTRVGVAVHIVVHVARAVGPALHATPTRALAPESVILGYDGSVSLADLSSSTPSGATRLDALRAKPAYLAPEQVSGGDVDRRADVWSLGVVLWELLTGTTLFARATASETRIAIVDDPILGVRDVNPEVPAIVADVLGTALERDRKARFDTPEAFAKALEGAAASCGFAGPSKQELGAWVAERVPRTAGSGPRSSPGRAAPAPPPPPAPDVPDFDVPGASRAHRSLPKMEAVKVPSAPELLGAVPSFDVNAMAAAALAPSQAGASAPPSSGRGSSPALPSGAPQAPRASMPSAPAAQAGGGRSIAFDGGDDDDFDMEIERNVAGTSMPTAQSSRTSGTHAAARPSGQAGKLGLELAAPSRMVRERTERAAEGYEPGTGIKLAGLALVTLLGGGTALVLWKYVHHAGGFDMMRSMPHAFDGTSATESGAVSLVALVIAVTVGFIGLRFKPHAWAVVAAGGAILLLALAMVTVTLASTGENPTPPDGALLVPYLFPAAVLMLAIGVEGRAARLFATSYGIRRVSAVPIAAFGGAIAFLAFEASRFAR
jgi:hypothetical protein